MKKILTLVLVLMLTLFLLTACGGGGANNGNNAPSNSVPSNNENRSTPASDNEGQSSTPDTNTSPEQDADLDKSSQLIPLEDAKRIVHESLEVSIDKKTNEPELDIPSRSLPGFTTTYSGNSFLILSVTVNYNESYIAGIKRDLDAGLVVSEEVEGVGDWAAFIESVGKSLYIGYEDIFLNITLTGLKSVSIAEEDMDEIFMELGRLACKNYDALK